MSLWYCPKCKTDVEANITRGKGVILFCNCQSIGLPKYHIIENSVDDLKAIREKTGWKGHMTKKQHEATKKWRSKKENRLSENARNRRDRRKNMTKYKKSILFSTIRCYMRKGILTLKEIEEETKDLSLRVKKNEEPIFANQK